MKVGILRVEPNSIAGASSQFVNVADVSKEIALLFEAYRKGRKTLDETLDELEELTINERVTTPFSVYVNIHSHYGSIYFIKTDLLNRTPGDNLDESKRLASMGRGLRVFMKQNRLQIINPFPIIRIDLFTEDGLVYEIAKNGDVLKPGYYNMFKCYEIVGLTDQEIEWCYLMAAQDCYDTATNNCLSFSKRIIRELHKHIMNGEDLDSEELRGLNRLYISSSSETFVDGLQSRLSSFMSPRLLPVVVVILFGLMVLYIEWRLNSHQK